MGLKTKRTMLFLCPPCRDGLFQVPVLIKTVEALRDDVQQLQSRLSTLPTNTTEQPRAAGDALAAGDVIAEMAERERRACNIIVAGARESDSAEAADRLKHDESLLKQVLVDAGNVIDISDVKKVVRLGKKVDSGDSKPRLMKVILRSRECAIEILKNKSKLSDVRVFNDQTPKQREDLRALRETLKVRQEQGESDLTIKYIRGVPKIIQLKN